MELVCAINFVLLIYGGDLNCYFELQICGVLICGATFEGG